MTGHEQVIRHIRQNWLRVRAYRDLEQMERNDGREIEARRWHRYRAETLRMIRDLREVAR